MPSSNSSNRPGDLSRLQHFIHKAREMDPWPNIGQQISIPVLLFELSERQACITDFEGEHRQPQMLLAAMSPGWMKKDEWSYSVKGRSWGRKTAKPLLCLVWTVVYLRPTTSMDLKHCILSHSKMYLARCSVACHCGLLTNVPLRSKYFMHTILIFTIKLAFTQQTFIQYLLSSPDLKSME